MGRFLSKLLGRRVSDEDLRAYILKEVVAVNRALHEAGIYYCYDYKLVCDDADLRKYTLYLYKVAPFSRHELVFSDGIFDQIRDIIRDLPK